MRTAKSQIVEKIKFSNSPKECLFKPHSEVLKKNSGEQVEGLKKLPSQKSLDIKKIELPGKNVNIKEIFPKGAGVLHIYDPQDLPISK